MLEKMLGGCGQEVVSIKCWKVLHKSVLLCKRQEAVILVNVTIYIRIRIVTLQFKNKQYY